MWLRTCYSEDSNVKHEALVQGIDMEMAVGGEYRLLDEPKSYNFDTLPELLQPQPSGLGFSGTYVSSKQTK